MNLSRYKNIQPYLAALFAVFVWGAFPSLIKNTLQITSVDELLTLRFLFSTLLILRILASTLKKIKLLPPSNLIIFIVIVISVFCSQAYALDEVPATCYVAVFTFVPIIFLMIHREPLNKTVLAGSALAILGMMVFIFSMQQQGKLNPWNFLLVFVSMLTWVAYSLFTKKMQHSFLDREIVAMTSLIGFVSSLLIWSLHGFHIQNLSLSGFGLCLLAGVLLPLALTAYSFSLRLNAVFAIFSQYLEPVFGLMIAVVLLGEKINNSQLLGASIIVSGMFLVGVAVSNKAK